jgi:hypothetical protein
VPSEAETVISQLARTVWGGRNAVYLATIAGTTVILVMAANTAFADFPRLSALQAADGFLPRQLIHRGSRLVFSRGIAVLGGISSVLIVVFDASVTALIPLYAIGVFLSFTLSQAGMTRRWWKSGQLQEGQQLDEKGSSLRHDPRWRLKMVTNAAGAVATAIVTVVFAVTKFREGAWFVIVLIPVLVAAFYAIHGHYRDLAGKLSLEAYGAPGRMRRHRVIMPISGIHRGTVAALRYAHSLSDDITAVFVVRLIQLESPYRLLLEPLLDYIEHVEQARQPDEVLTIVVPQFVPERWWHHALHSQTAVLLRMALLDRPGVVITSVPYKPGEEDLP